MKESDLYMPVKNLFTQLHYEVNGEVKNIDVTAIKGNDIIIIELKSTFSLKLVLQAIERQRITDQVYVAIPRPQFKQRLKKSFKEKEYLLRRLGVGLILVALDVKIPYAQIIFDPIPFKQNIKLSSKKKNLALKELSERHGDHNLGGTRGKLVTAYREKALLIVYYLNNQEEMTVKALREATGNEKVQTLLQNNHYLWFERVQKGVYKLSNEGRIAYDEYKNIIDKIK
ncbi:MAG: hypothetical protein CVV02_11030 [Firmicutes bacterium HGW-Firmicutes-7]|nr:MAG: hypothetical protein CVV02_11030 [Firmicutes bacterium HGW-Firmicutes-7]